MNKQKGNKWDKGKPRYDLLPPEVLEQIVEVFTEGAKKYGDYNWTQGIEYGRVFAAAQRHQWAFWSGEDVDDESQQHHLAHAIVNLMFLLEYETRDMNYLDDRVDKEKNNV